MKLPLQIMLFLISTFVHVSTKAGSFDNFINNLEEANYVIREDSIGREILTIYAEKRQIRAIKSYEYNNTNSLPKFMGELSFNNETEWEVFLKGIRNYRGKKIVPYELPLQNSEPIFKTEDNAVIWPTSNQWSMAWELKYSEWVQSEVDENFYERYQIATDCADVAVSLRWIFSRIHGLPAGFRLAGSNALFTNESMRTAWTQLSTNVEWNKDELFMTSLTYVMGMTYTHSLIKDSYPLKITPEYFMPGVHHLDMHSPDTGHTMFLFRMGIEVGGLLLMYSNVPEIVREMYVTGFYDSSQYSGISEGGFFKIRWPVKSGTLWSLKPAEQMPGFSLEQYDPAFLGDHEAFNEAVLEKLGLFVDPLVVYEQLKTTFLNLIDDRIKIVEDGYNFCKSNDCSPGTQNYEVWSTPSRDKRIANIAETIDQLSWQYFSVYELWNNLLQSKTYKISNKTVSLQKIVEKFQWGEVSSDPRDSIKSRWGL